MTLKPTINRCCGTDLTLSAPATIQDWLEILGEERCCDLIFKMQCYSRANALIRQALRYDPHARSYTDSEKAHAVELANRALLTRD